MGWNDAIQSIQLILFSHIIQKETINNPDNKDNIQVLGDFPKPTIGRLTIREDPILGRDL